MSITTQKKGAKIHLIIGDNKPRNVREEKHTHNAKITFQKSQETKMRSHKVREMSFHGIWPQDFLQHTSKEVKLPRLYLPLKETILGHATELRVDLGSSFFSSI